MANESFTQLRPSLPGEHQVTHLPVFSCSWSVSRRYLRNSQQSCWRPGSNQGGRDAFRNSPGEKMERCEYRRKEKVDCSRSRTGCEAVRGADSTRSQKLQVQEDVMHESHFLTPMGR